MSTRITLLFLLVLVLGASTALGQGPLNLPGLPELEERVAAGTGVALILSNGANLPLPINWLLVKAGTGPEVAKRGREAGPDNHYVQPGDPDVIAHAGLVEPGERGEVRFAAPPSGSYHFVCTFPGIDFCMVGDFVVTP